jgi:hypothetical protein
MPLFDDNTKGRARGGYRRTEGRRSGYYGGGPEPQIAGMALGELKSRAVIRSPEDLLQFTPSGNQIKTGVDEPIDSSEFGESREGLRAFQPLQEKFEPKNDPGNTDVLFRKFILGLIGNQNPRTPGAAFPGGNRGSSAANQSGGGISQADSYIASAAPKSGTTSAGEDLVSYHGYDIARSAISRVSAFSRVFNGLTIGSAYRDPTHNASVGGVANSNHLTGRAVDFSIPGMSGSAEAEALRPMAEWAKSNLPGVTYLIHDAGSGMHLHMNFL